MVRHNAGNSCSFSALYKATGYKTGDPGLTGGARERETRARTNPERTHEGTQTQVTYFVRLSELRFPVRVV